MTMIATHVRGLDGFEGTIMQPEDPAASTTTTHILTREGRNVVVPTSLLELQPDGSFYLPISEGDLSSGNSGAQAADAAATPPRIETLIPLVEEHLEVKTQRVDRAVIRIIKSVETHEQVVDTPLCRDEVSVERVPVGRFVDTPPAVRHEGPVIIIPVLEEVVVVEKRLLLKEELRVTTRQIEIQDHQVFPLRKEVTRVERTPIEKTATDFTK